MNFGLSLILLGFAQMQPGTLVTRWFSSAILLLAVAFFASAYGLLLPRWMTVIGTNMLLISAGVILHTGFAAFCTQQLPRCDRLGWFVVALTAVPFGYWGLIEPNGNFRSVVFSVALVLINGRTAFLLLREALHSANRLPIIAMGALFMLLTLWMLVRGILLLQAEPIPPDVRGSNPTQWITVFCYIVLVALMTGCVIWMEVNRLCANVASFGLEEQTVLGGLKPARANLILLWSTVIILCLAISSEVLIAYQAMYQSEYQRLQQSVTLANAAFVEQASQLLKQADQLLRVSRDYYQTQDVAFLNSTRPLIDGVYLFDTDHRWLNQNTGNTINPKISDLDQHFNYHQSNLADTLYFGSVQRHNFNDQNTAGFAISRRLNKANGEFAGIVLTLLQSSQFSGFYQKLMTHPTYVVSLLNTSDHLPRAQHPESDIRPFSKDSPLWQALSLAPSGNFQESAITEEGAIIDYNYQRVVDLPLVMVSGFLLNDVSQFVLIHISPIAFGAVLTILAIVTLAFILTTVIRQREEQSQFLSMLSHELKTPLAVIRLALGSETLSARIKQLAARSVMEMNTIIERCLQADRLYHGRFSIMLEKCDLSHEITELCANSLAPERLLFSPSELSCCKTDKQIIRVILSNLIDNALKYSPADQPVRVVAALTSHHHKEGITAHHLSVCLCAT